MARTTVPARAEAETAALYAWVTQRGALLVARQPAPGEAHEAPHVASAAHALRAGTWAPAAVTVVDQLAEVW